MQTLSRKSPRTLNGRRSRATTAVAVGDIDRQRRDAGISARTLAVAAGVDAGYLSQIFAGTREPSIAVLSALSGVLGATLSVRVYPNTGPTIRDGIQARIVEELLRVVAPTWRPSIEVAVTRPARGVIDVVFEHSTSPIFVATEVHSRIDRLEQQVRWAEREGEIAALVGPVATRGRAIRHQPAPRTPVHGRDSRTGEALRGDASDRLSGGVGARPACAGQRRHRLARSRHPLGRRRRGRGATPGSTAARCRPWPLIIPRNKVGNESGITTGFGLGYRLAGR